MAIEVKIPSVGESVTSGIVSAWHKKSGEFVDEGETLFTLETDKVSTEIVAEKAGVLETKVPEGREVKIGEVVAIIDDSKKAPQEKKEEKLLEEKRSKSQKRKNLRKRRKNRTRRKRLPKKKKESCRRKKKNFSRPQSAASSKKRSLSPRKFPEPAQAAA